MNRLSYSLLGYLLLPLLVAKLVIKGVRNQPYRKRIAERLGFIPKQHTPVIWLHCVSVGEFRAAIPLIDLLIDANPNYKIFISTTTPTGSSSVLDYYADLVVHYYFPFDSPWIMRRYLTQLNPKICILLETEIWPNLIHQLHKARIPCLLINARLSEKSLKKYQKIPKLTKQTLKKLTLIATQNNNSAKRFLQLGADNSQVMTVGNIKFDLKIQNQHTTLEQLQTIINGRTAIVFASTHLGEEEEIIKSYKKQTTTANPLLVIIPRHPERFKQVFELSKKYNLVTLKRSDHKVCTTKTQVLIGDSMGEVLSFYKCCRIAFIGGSLNKTGGHNMLEAAALGKPIIFGPNVFNFSEISTALLAVDGAIQVQNSDMLWRQINKLLTHKKRSDNLGKNAKDFFEKQQGAIEKITKLVQSQIP